MSSPEQLAAQGEENDTVPELPHGPSVAAAYGNAAVHNALHHSSPKVPSPKVTYYGPDLGRQTSHASSVDVGFFDPEGVHQLRQTLSRMSAADQGEHAQSVQSSVETAVMDEKFDFEKVLREVMSKCVLCFSLFGVF